MQLNGKIRSLVVILLVLGMNSTKISALEKRQNDIHFIIKVHTAKEEMKQPKQDNNDSSEYTLTSKFIIGLYQLMISSQDKETCNFTVSCSDFMINAIQKYGVLNGLLIGSDRLQRCNGLGKIYYPTDLVLNLAIDFPVDDYYLFNQK